MTNLYELTKGKSIRLREDGKDIEFDEVIMQFNKLKGWTYHTKSGDKWYDINLTDDKCSIILEDDLSRFLKRMDAPDIVLDYIRNKDNPRGKQLGECMNYLYGIDLGIETEGLDIIYKKYFKENRGWAIVIEPYEALYLNTEFKRRIIMRMLHKDYICVEHKQEFLQAVSYRPKHFDIPEIGSLYKREGNDETSFGEGLYAYKFDSRKIYNEIDDKVLVYFEGIVDYWECIASNDEPKDNEILILPHTPIKVCKYINGL